jgi:hypothetical protein
MDTALAAMPDTVWMKRVLPNAEVAFRSNNRDVQARLCAQGDWRYSRAGSETRLLEFSAWT